MISSRTTSRPESWRASQPENATRTRFSRRFSGRGAALAGHLLFGAVAAWLASRLIPGAQVENPAIRNPQALTDLAVLARWPWKFTILVLLAGTVPFLSFVAERKVTHRVRAALAEPVSGSAR